MTIPLKDAMMNPQIAAALKRDAERELTRRVVASGPSTSSPGPGNVKGAPSPRPSCSPVTFSVFAAPVSQNACYQRSRQGRMFMTPEGKAWKKLVADCATLAMTDRAPFEGDVRVTLVFWFPTRRNDFDGPLKPTVDALQGVVFKNDRQVVEGHIFKRRDKARPRAEITVEPA